MPLNLLSPARILTNATMLTMAPGDPAPATALAISDGRLLALGDDASVLALAGPGTQREDLGGAVVIPGLIDAHNHLLSVGLMLSQVQLFDCRTIGEIVARVAARAADLPPGTWIVGRGWDESLLAEGRHPTRHDLDPVSPAHPVVLQRVWNKLTCNSAALAAAGITAQTPDPPAEVLYAGSFERDAHGDPTGLFRDRAKELLLSRIPAPTAADLIAAIQTAGAAYNALGITTVAEPGLHPAELRAFDLARHQGQLTVRTDLLLAGWGFDPPETQAGLEDWFAGFGVVGNFGDPMLRLGGIKLMPDGGMSDLTARMFTPYLDQPDHRGTWVVAPDHLRRAIGWVHELGWSMDIHTCGDEAQAVVVEAFAAAMTARPRPWLRHRVHHAYFPTPATLELMARHQIPAVVSSPFLTNLGEGFVNAVGAERAGRAMPMRTYLNAGVPLAGSSDAPITDFNPWAGMQAAVSRTTVTGRELDQTECLTPHEALASYTTGGAFATGREAWQGTLTPGKLADLVVLPTDPLADPAALAATRPLATMLGGEWVFDRR